MDEKNTDVNNEYENFLKKLDNAKSSRFDWFLTILATLGGFLFGYDTTNIGTVKVLLPLHILTTNSLIVGYIVSGAAFGAAAGALIATLFIDKYGRKSILMVDAGLYAIGAVISALAFDTAILIIGRTIVGIAVGADTAVATLYIAEWASRKKRGTFGIMQQWMVTIGILGAYLISLSVLYSDPSGAFTIDWKLMLGIAAIPAIIGLIYRFLMPESPRWLVFKQKYKKAVASLKRFGVVTTEEELRREFPYKEVKKTKLTPGAKRALVIAGLFLSLEEVTGINIPFYYGPTIIANLHIFGVPTSKVAGIELDVLTAVILAVINVAATYIGFRYIDSIGRRTLSVIAYSGMAVSAFIGAFLYFIGVPIGMLIFMALFIVFFAFGVGAIGWVIQSEYFPMERRGLYTGIMAFCNWFSDGILILIFPTMDKAIGIDGSFTIFGILSVIAAIIFYYSMPVTRGKSIDKTSEIFEDMAKAHTWSWKKYQKENHENKNL